MRRFVPPTLFILPVTMLALRGCGNDKATPQARLILHRRNQTEPMTLDPHQLSGSRENNITGWVDNLVDVHRSRYLCKS